MYFRYPRPVPPYLDLGVRDRWRAEDLADLAGLRSRIEESARAGGPVVLGGVAPAWAFAAALQRALDVEPQVQVAVFDPKAETGWVEVPSVLFREPGSRLGECLEVAWRERKLFEICGLQGSSQNRTVRSGRLGGPLRGG